MKVETAIVPKVKKGRKRKERMEVIKVAKPPKIKRFIKRKDPMQVIGMFRWNNQIYYTIQKGDGTMNDVSSLNARAKFPDLVLAFLEHTQV
jgi:hypothetical protein